MQTNENTTTAIKCILLKKYFTLLFFCFGMAVCHAQIVNVDVLDTAGYKKKAVLKADISISLEADKQQKLLLDGSNFLNTTLQKNKTLLIFDVTNRFTYDDNKDLLNTGFIHFRWRYLYKNKISPEAYTQYQWDAVRGLLQRYLLGANIRYNLLHKNKWDMAIGGGPMYENELWNYKGVDTAIVNAKHLGGTVHTDVIKFNSYFKLEVLPTDAHHFSLVVFYQSLFTNFFKPRVAGKFDYSIKLSKHFNLNFIFNCLYDAKPIVPVPQFYYSFSNGITYSF